MSVAKSVRKITWKLLRGGPGRRPRILTVQTQNGLLSFSNMDLVIGKGLYVDRAFEFDLINRIMDYLRREGLAGRGDAMIDVGANVGMICIAMLKHGHFRRALAFEPAPENFALLQRNIVQNGMRESIRAYPCALSDRVGETELELSETNFGDHRLRGAANPGLGLLGEERRRTVRVSVRTLDDVLVSDAAQDAERIGLVWVDIQGHEAQFFAGARETLSLGMPVVSEFWPYGIGRAGLGASAFGAIAASLFAEFVHVEPRTLRITRHPVDRLTDFFATFPGPDDHQQLVFLPRARGR